MLLADLAAHAAAGRSVVVDDTLCYRWLRDRWRQAAREAGLTCQLLVLAPSRQEIMFRFGATREPGNRPTLECKRLLRHLDAFEWPLADEDAVDVTTLARQESWLIAEANALGRDG
jgi:predicted kinase